VIVVTLKKRMKNTFVILLPFIVFTGAVALGGVFREHGDRYALVFLGTQNPKESILLIRDELEGESPEKIQKTIDTLDIPEHTPPIATAPSDKALEELIERAKEEQANAKMSGSIVEATYGSKNATNTYKNVAVRNKTNSHSIDIKECLNAKCKLEIKDKDKPTVLIFHTHTTESYEMLDRGWYSNDFPTRSSSPDTNMVRVGNAICDSLTNAGYNVIHDTTIYDTSYKGSYSRSRAAIEKYKSEFPSLQIILDIHRDGIISQNGTKTKPVKEINGQKAAQIMIIAGCEDGNIDDFPNWKDNLNFAVQLQSEAESKYPGLMRPIYFCPRKYNMDTSYCGLLLEMGSDANTLKEAVYSGKLIGDSIASLMNKYTKIEE